MRCRAAASSGRHGCAASRHASAGDRRRTPAGRVARTPCPPPAARNTRSARDRSCRTAAPRSGAADAGNSTVIVPEGFSRIGSPATKSFRSGTCASTLLAQIRSACRPAAARALRAVATPKNATSVGTPLASRHRGDVGGWLHAQYIDAAPTEILQQVAVVARHFHDQRIRTKPEFRWSCAPRRLRHDAATNRRTTRNTDSR